VESIDPAPESFRDYRGLKHCHIEALNKMELLLAIDLGVKTGLAMYSSDGRLLWYRSHNYGNKARLKKAIPTILSEDDLRYIVIEGGGPLLKMWTQEADRKNIETIPTMANDWRQEILFAREQRKGKDAKHNAVIYARHVIEHLAENRATSLTNDAAEAILIGLWGMLKVGWIRDIKQVTP
jgi:hypothetical protein